MEQMHAARTAAITGPARNPDAGNVRDVVCSICGQSLRDGAELCLDSREYDPRSCGDDWTWHHLACERARLPGWVGTTARTPTGNTGRTHGVVGPVEHYAEPISEEGSRRNLL